MYLGVGMGVGIILGIVLIVFVVLPASTMESSAMFKFPFFVWSGVIILLSAALGGVSAYAFLSRQTAGYYRDKLKSAMEVGQTKDSFISMILHHIRTPLSGMRWITKEMLDHAPAGLPTEPLKQLYKANIRALDAVSHLITASQASMGRIQYQFEITSLEELQDIIAKSIQLLEASARAKGLRLTTTIVPVSKPSSVNVDREKIATIVQTILENAIHYTPQGGRITVVTEQKERAFIITVSDTGIGIPATERDKIFTQFYRAKNAAQIHPEGFGVGMFLVKTFIDRHQGSVRFESEVNEGTIFTIRIPLYIVST